MSILNIFHEDHSLRPLNIDGKRIPLKRSNWICSPIVLFSVSLVQVIFCYVFWDVAGLNLGYDYSINYYPLNIYIAGYVLFCASALLVKTFVSRKRSGGLLRTGTEHGLVNTKPLLILLIALAVLAIQQYGGIPILKMGLGEMFIEDVNAAQETALPGLFGLLTAGTIVGGIVTSVNFFTRKSQFGFDRIFLFVIIFITIMNSKRQGLFIIIFSLVISFLMRGGGGGAYDFVGRITGIRAKISANVFVLATFVTLVFGFGLVENYRTKIEENKFSPRAIVRYMEWPLINFIYQTELVAYGPKDLKILGPLQMLIPFKYIDFEKYDLPRRLEKSSPSGIWSEIVWFWGFPGVIVYAILYGGLAQYVFMKAGQSNRILYLYILLAWAILTSGSYNHIFNLNFLVLPVIVCVLYVAFLSITRIIYPDRKQYKSVG